MWQTIDACYLSMRSEVRILVVEDEEVAARIRSCF